MSLYDVTRANTIGPIVFTMKGHDTPMTVDGEGVLTINVHEHNACMVASGTVIKGVRLVNADGVHPDYEVDPVTNLAQFPMYMIVVEDGGLPLTIVHESGDVSEPRERISVDDGASTAIDTKMVQVFFWGWLDGGTGRARAFDWPGV